MEDWVGHNCGLFGVYNVQHAAAVTSLGMFAVQHRGEESAGIAASDGRKITSKKGMGLVTEVFTQNVLDQLPGHIAVGHVRYSTTGSSRVVNIQPLVIDCSHGLIAVAHNGNLVNARTLRDEFEAYGSIFQTSTDSEIIVHLLAHRKQRNLIPALQKCLRRIKGAFSFLFMTRDSLIAARDPQGFRPLVLGRIRQPGQLANIREGFAFASETCALDQVGAVYEREVEPGEILQINTDGLHSTHYMEPDEVKPAHCIFEHVYFARPDSTIFGDSVHDVRIRLGEQLAEEQPADADVVFPVPDSGNSAAIGYSRRSGISYDVGFIRNHYVGRSFIKPQQIERESMVNLKTNAVRSVVDGKRVVVVDDSLVRGTTFRKQARFLRRAGAKEIHLRISCPPTRHACFYGIDFQNPEQLAAARYSTVEGIRKSLGIESVGYLSVEGMLSCVSHPPSHYCTACWTQKYPVPPIDQIDKHGMEDSAEGRNRRS